MSAETYYNQQDIEDYMRPAKQKIKEAFTGELPTLNDIEDQIAVTIEGFTELKEAIKFFKRRMAQDNWNLIYKAYEAKP